jgi:hypothetical protein
MNPHPDECRPGRMVADYVPSVVEYLPGNRARVWHPLGADHENARLTRERLARKGFHVTAPNAPTVYRRSTP